MNAKFPCAFSNGTVIPNVSVLKAVDPFENMGAPDAVL
jgi:hypothetical protein